MNDAEGLLLEAERRARRTSPPPALGTHRYREPRIPLGCRFPRLAFHSLIHGINFNNKNLAGKHRCVARAPSGKAKEVLVGGWRADCQLICYLSAREARALVTSSQALRLGSNNSSNGLHGGFFPSSWRSPPLQPITSTQVPPSPPRKFICYKLSEQSALPTRL